MHVANRLMRSFAALPQKLCKVLKAMCLGQDFRCEPYVQTPDRGRALHVSLADLIVQGESSAAVTV